MTLMTSDIEAQGSPAQGPKHNFELVLTTVAGKVVVVDTSSATHLQAPEFQTTTTISPIENDARASLTEREKVLVLDHFASYGPGLDEAMLLQSFQVYRARVDSVEEAIALLDLTYEGCFASAAIQAEDFSNLLKTSEKVARDLKVSSDAILLGLFNGDERITTHVENDAALNRIFGHLIEAGKGFSFTPPEMNMSAPEVSSQVIEKIKAMLAKLDEEELAKLMAKLGISISPDELKSTLRETMQSLENNIPLLLTQAAIASMLS